jgi:hypothetical protein
MMAYVLIKSYQNKWVILGQELTENNLRKESIQLQYNGYSLFCSHFCSFLFRFHISAAANRDWPDGRGIFLGDRRGYENIRFLSWCNEADHFRFISMQPGGNLGQVYSRLLGVSQFCQSTMSTGTW